jgi:hypothetical protein
MRTQRLIPTAIVACLAILLYCAVASCQAEHQVSTTPAKLAGWASYLSIEERNGRTSTSHWKVSFLDEKADLPGGVWVEMVQEGDGSKHVYKMLVTLLDQASIENPLCFWDKVERLIIQTDKEEPKEVRKELISRYLPHVAYGQLRSPGVQVTETQPTKTTELGSEKLDAGGKSYACAHTRIDRRLHSKLDIVIVKTESDHDQVISLWKSPDAPFFGFVKYAFEESKRTLPREGQADQGRVESLKVNITLEGAAATGAKSEITGKPTMLEQAPAFPFGELGKQQKKSGTPKPQK